MSHSPIATIVFTNQTYSQQKLFEVALRQEALLCINEVIHIVLFQESEITAILAREAKCERRL